jgi:hypothetical protein
MSQVSFALLIVIGLTLTAYFGVAAWRLSDDRQIDITGHFLPAQQNAWRPISAPRANSSSDLISTLISRLIIYLAS